MMSPKTAVLYIRELPGGGYVAIEGQPQDDATYRGYLCVERRSSPERRVGHTPPSVVEATGRSQSDVFHDLVSVANSNVAVATALLRWQSTHYSGADDAL